MQIWPAIDLRGGKCVRLRQGDCRIGNIDCFNPVASIRNMDGEPSRIRECVQSPAVGVSPRGQPILMLIEIGAGFLAGGESDPDMFSVFLGNNDLGKWFSEDLLPEF